MNIDRIAISKEIKDAIIAPIPDALIKQREGGGKKMLSYLSGSTITDMLNNAFGYMWSWEVKKEWIEQSEPSINRWVNGKKENDPNKWISEAQGPVAHVLGTITVYLKNGNSPLPITISKDGFGSKSVLGKQNDQESVFKAAGTDALKKAASLFGIGLELYRDEDESAYFNEINYEDPWTDEAKEAKAKEMEYISKYIADYQVSDEDFDNFVYETTGDSYDITPDNIDLIVNTIKDGLAAAK
jgi:recombination DNA repair RAD52 pathway protein